MRQGADKHGLTEGQIISALEGMASPMMAFDSATVKDGIVMVVDVPNVREPVVVAVHMRQEVGRVVISRVASIH